MDLPPIADGEDKSSELMNCLRNRYRHIRKWAKRTQCDCFRLYDREIKAYPIAIDFYAGHYCIHYFAGNDLEEPPPHLRTAVESALNGLFQTQPSAIFWRTRARSHSTRQYEKKRDAAHQFFTVSEYGVKFWVNLTDYLDTGLFLDHRETRRLVASLAKRKRLLNLFAYTCSFSVQAAAHGALYTKSVDMSNTYTAWGRDNFTLNGLSDRNNPIVRADCLKFLEEESELYDLIVIDPPTISRSKKMEQLFDLQHDYTPLLRRALQLLSEGGQLFFSTNSRKFQFDPTLFPGFTCSDISEKTLPLDFTDSKIHRCWRFDR